MNDMKFLTHEQVLAIRDEHGSPVFVYDQASLETAADTVMSFPNAFGLTARYAMKALPTAAVVQTLCARGLHIDASSGFEAERAINAGVNPAHIQITAQEIPKDLKGLVEQGVQYNACSLHQLRVYGELFPGGEVSVRINPGLGSGHNNRTNVGGPSSSFGIWHEKLPEIEAVRAEFNLNITAMHTHVGSGGDPEVWKACAKMSLDIAAQLPDVATLSLGGGFKVARMPGEVPADLQAIGEVIVEDFKAFAQEHGRELHMEIEPGTFLVANAGAIITSVMDVVDTGEEGYQFLKIDGGMTEVLRPSLYGAQQPITLVKADGSTPEASVDYIVVGHCCESGDILTPAPGDSEALAPRRLPASVVGDALVIGGAGAYCASMASKNYNSFPEATEVMLMGDGTVKLIRKRQSLEQILANEVL